MSSSKSDFLAKLQNLRNCYAFIDESGLNIDRYDQSDANLVLMARHYGHNLVLIVHRSTILSPTVRGQCARAWLFCPEVDDAVLVFSEFGVRHPPDGEIGPNEGWLVDRFLGKRSGVVRRFTQSIDGDGLARLHIESI